jgi:uncharacterized RDD family membrane protein YckC
MISEDRPIACPICGEVCRCAAEAQGSPHSSRFKLDTGATPRQNHNPSVLVDPETYDNSEEQLAASLENSTSVRQRFVVEQSHTVASNSRPRILIDTEPSRETQQSAVRILGTDPPQQAASSLAPSFSLQTDGTADPNFWKQEVTARLDSYRARRKPKGPRYPSLRLRFETSEDSNSEGSAQPPFASSLRARSAETQASQLNTEATTSYPSPALHTLAHMPVVAPEPARVIEFPRSYEPPARSDELAEPVFERPRILDAPEIVPPPPALGGIILEPEEKEPERRPGFELPLQSAQGKARVLATLIDAGIVLLSSALFIYAFFLVTHLLPPVTQWLPLVLVVPGFSWVIYDYLLMVYVGHTPGMRACKLALRQFDGTSVGRNTRRWRMLASILSLIPIGLGLLWCFLDEDSLCWHDRITSTHLVFEPGESLGVADDRDD